MSDIVGVNGVVYDAPFMVCQSPACGKPAEKPREKDFHSSAIGFNCPHCGTRHKLATHQGDSGTMAGWWVVDAPAAVEATPAA